MDYQPIRTRLTERFGLSAPIVSAPMAFASGGRLAAAVSAAGALGLIGGGYGDADWLDEQWQAAGDAAVGCGFITWTLAERRELLSRALARHPRAMFLSFGDLAPFADEVKAAGVPLIAQVQNLESAGAALAAGADAIVAQGSEAGGHGAMRATMTLVPEVADLVAGRALVLAAGGIADGRGLAASLMLGADGVVVGTRFWASEEALVAPGFQRAALAADGDGTLRSSLPDVARGFDWPGGFTVRTLRNAWTRRWQGDADGPSSEAVRANYARAVAAGDALGAPAIVGEAIGLVRDIRPAAGIVAQMMQEAQAALSRW